MHDEHQHDDLNRDEANTEARFIEAHRALSEALALDDLEPDPERGDWASQSELIDGAIESAQQLMGSFDELRPALDEEQAEGLRSATVQLGLGLLALLRLSSRRDEAGALISTLASLTREESEEDLLQAARPLDPQDFLALQHAIWLLDHDRRGQARAVAATIAQGQGPLAPYAEAIAQLPEPMHSAPGLGTFNGVGTMLYGHRDPHPDGSYVATRFFTVLFLPLLPLDAFRVADAEEGGWYFLGKVPLSGLTRAWRWVLPLTIVALIALLSWQNHLDSSSYKYSKALTPLVKEVPSAKTPSARKALAKKLERLVNLYSNKVSAAALQPATAKMFELLTANVSEPFAAKQLWSSKRLVKRLTALPHNAKSGPATRLLIAKLLTWSGQIGAKDEAALDAALKLLDDARELAPLGHADHERVDTLRRGVLRKKATLQAKDWPLAAIRSFLRINDKAALKSAASIFEARLSRADDATWVALAPEIGRFRQQYRTLQLSNLDNLDVKLRAALGAAKKAMAAGPFRALLAQKEAAPLRAALAKTKAGRIPNQQLALRLARLLEGGGKNKEALSLLEGLGKPGELIFPVQLTLARLYADADQLPRADKLLEMLLARRLPVFERARKAYLAADRQLRKRLVERARQGLERALERRLKGLDKTSQRRAFAAWLDKRLASDGDLSRLRKAYIAAAKVTPLALQLGTVKLRLARSHKGARRQLLLAAAERAFLAIQGEAQGIPSYHLGLGQVYHRLGKAKEGERELGALLAKKEPALSRAVASVYRELGMIKRARTVAKKIFDEHTGEHRSGAAVLLALLADNYDEAEGWWRKADQKSPFVRNSLANIAANKLFDQGKLAAADRKFAEVAANYEKGAKTSSAAANNAALAHQRRFACTGDRKHVAKAVALLRRARGLAPDSALVLNNLASALEFQLVLAVLSKDLDLRVLRPTTSAAGQLFSHWIWGPQRKSIQERLRRHGGLRELLDIYHQEQTLAPSRADAYDNEKGWLLHLDDLDGLSKLVARLTSLDKGTITARVDWKALAAGKHDDKAQRTLERRLAQLLILKGKSPRPGPTAAAIEILIAGAHTRLAMLKSDASHAKRAAVSFAAAQRQAPNKLLLSGPRAVTLARAAVISVAKSTSALAALWRKGRHTMSWGLLVEAAKRPGLRATLARHPDMRAAIALRKNTTKPGPTTYSDYALAVLSGDDAWGKKLKKSFPTRRRKLVTAIDTILAPGDPELPLEHEAHERMTPSAL